MALFASDRDASVIRRFNKELLHNIVCIEVKLYKIALNEMDEPNIYGESDTKRYYNPVKIAALIRKDDSVVLEHDTGELNTGKNISIGFIRDDLVDANYVLEIGDIIWWDGGYYEVDNVRSTNYWWGKNPSTFLAFNDGVVSEHGYAHSIIAETHRTALDTVQIADPRSGTHTLKQQPKKPRYL